MRVNSLPKGKSGLIERSELCIEHGGYQYDVKQFVEIAKSGIKENQAVRSLCPTVPQASINPILIKLRRHPYYKAYKELQLSILKERGPDLQQNLLDIALEGKSERNRLDATVNALDRVYGADKNEPTTPNFVFNFSFGGSPAKVRSVESRASNEIIEGEVIETEVTGNEVAGNEVSNG